MENVHEADDDDDDDDEGDPQRSIGPVAREPAGVPFLMGVGGKNKKEEGATRPTCETRGNVSSSVSPAWPGLAWPAAAAAAAHDEYLPATQPETGLYRVLLALSAAVVGPLSSSSSVADYVDYVRPDKRWWNAARLLSGRAIGFGPWLYHGSASDVSGVDGGRRERTR